MKKVICSCNRMFFWNIVSSIDGTTSEMIMILFKIRNAKPQVTYGSSNIFNSQLFFIPNFSFAFFNSRQPSTIHLQVLFKLFKNHYSNHLQYFSSIIVHREIEFSNTCEFFSALKEEKFCPNGLSTWHDSFTNTIWHVFSLSTFVVFFPRFIFFLSSLIGAYLLRSGMR